jgi:ABC-2 type transport system ATP-binding protein
MNSHILISVEHLYRYYSEKPAVHDVSFEVSRGEVVGFLGPNGAGKTTTMQIISGNLAPSAGRVRVNGVDILDEPKQAKMGLGYLPEQPPLYRELTVNEYLLGCARLNRIPRDRQKRAVEAAKKRCGLADVGHRLIGNLSKGYQQRVGIAQAIIHQPSVVILDEPTVGLDPIQIREIRALIKELGTEHSVILSTHILPEVQAVCDRVMIIHEGKIVLDSRLSHIAHLDKTLCLRLGVRSMPAEEELLTIPGVRSLENLGEHEYRVCCYPDQDPTQALLQRALESRWELYELVPERPTLEQVFVDLVYRETGDLTSEQEAPAC